MTQKSAIAVTDEINEVNHSDEESVIDKESDRQSSRAESEHAVAREWLSRYSEADGLTRIGLRESWSPFELTSHLQTLATREVVIVDLDNVNLDLESVNLLDQLYFVTLSNSVCNKQFIKHERVINYECKGMDRDLVDCAIVATIQSLFYLETRPSKIYLFTKDHFAASVERCYQGQVTHLYQLGDIGVE